MRRAILMLGLLAPTAAMAEMSWFPMFVLPPPVPPVVPFLHSIPPERLPGNLAPPPLVPYQVPTYRGATCTEVPVDVRPDGSVVIRHICRN